MMISNVLTRILAIMIFLGIFELANCLSVVALGLVNNTVLLYDWVNNAMLGSFLGQTGSQTQLKFLKNGYLVAQTGSLISVLNVVTQTSVYTYPSEILCTEVLNNGYLAVSWYDYTVRIIQLESQTLVGTFGTIGDYQTALKQTKIANYLASGSNKGIVRIWDTDSFALIRTLIHSATMSVRFLEVMSNGFLVSYAYDNSIKLWNILTGACLSTYFVSGTLAGMEVLSSDALVVAFGNTIELLNMKVDYQLYQNYSFTLPISWQTINTFSVSYTNVMILAVDMGIVGLFNLTSFSYKQRQIVPASMNTYIYKMDSTSFPRTPIVSISTNR
jgi:WD40 repeat protein